MNFVKSKNIKFYPTGYRGNIKIGNDNYSFDPESKLNTEENTRRTYNTLVTFKDIDQNKHNGDVVISKDYTYTEPPQQGNYRFHNFEFIISGYYVKILDADKAFFNIITTNANGKSIYAEIKIVNRGFDEQKEKNETNPILDENNTAIICRSVISLKPANTSGQSQSTTDDSTEGNENSNLDIDGEFTGINFIINDSDHIDENTITDKTIHIFKILEKIGNEWKVPASAKLMISLDDIYGGYELDAASKTIKTNTVKSNTIESNTVNSNTVNSNTVESNTVNATTVESNTVNATTVKTKNTVTEYITKDTTFDEGNISYIKLDEDSIKIHREDDESPLSSEISLKTDEIKLQQSKATSNCYIQIKDNAGKITPGNIELYAAGEDNTNPANIYMKKGEIKLQNKNSYINIIDNDSSINFHSQSVAEDIYNTVDNLSATHDGIFIQQEGTNEQSNNSYWSYINLNAGKYKKDYSSNQKIWIPHIMLSTKIYNSIGKVDKAFVTELTSEKVETPLLKVKEDSIQFNSVIPGHVSKIKSNSGNGEFNFYRNETEDPAKINAGALHLSGYNTTYLLEVYGRARINTLYLTGTGTSTDTILDAKAGVVAANSFYATSDRRLKDHIEPINYDKSILDLPVYTYTYKDSDKKQIGCMAQDLQKLYPELVSKDENGYLSVDNSKVVYLLLEEVKLLKKEIEDLKKSK